MYIYKEACGTSMTNVVLSEARMCLPQRKRSGNVTS